MALHAHDEAPAVERSDAEGVLVLKSGRVWLATRGARTALGYSPGALRGLPWAALAGAEGERWLADPAQGAGSGPGRTIARARLRRGDGTILVARLEIAPVEAGLVEVGLAPADPSAALDAALLHSVINTAPDAIVMIDATGRIQSFSPAAERMFGYRLEEVLGQNVGILMPEPYRSEHDDYLARYHRTGEKRIIGIGRTVIARHRSGATFPIELAVGEVRSGDRHLYTGFIRDISDRVAAEERTMALQQELSHAARLLAMGEIMTMIVHELNQPLTAIANFGEAARRLLEQGAEPARVGGFIEKSIGQAHRASEMIRRLRSFISPGSSEMEPIAINEVVRDAARLALIGAADQQILARLELAENLPVVLADRIQIQQVVVNLIRNAVDAMLAPPRSDPALLKVATSLEQGGAVRIVVEDTGPGIPPEVASGIFTPFVTTKPGGMGIGLSVCRSIVEAHGGRIWFEPAGARGSRFAFILPGRPAQGDPR